MFTTKGVLTAPGPQALVADTLTVKLPAALYVIPPGTCVFAVPGVPPVVVHA